MDRQEAATEAMKMLSISEFVGASWFRNYTTPQSPAQEMLSASRAIYLIADRSCPRYNPASNAVASGHRGTKVF
jgi:hypothetical protein